MYRMTAVNIHLYRTAADFAVLKQNKAVVMEHFDSVLMTVGPADHSMDKTYLFPRILYHNVDRTFFPPLT